MSKVEISDQPENVNYIALPVTRYQVAAWTPERDGNGKLEQLHVVLWLQGAEMPMVMRFKSAQSVQDFIDALERHKKDVWG